MIRKSFSKIISKFFVVLSIICLCMLLSSCKKNDDSSTNLFYDGLMVVSKKTSDSSVKEYYYYNKSGKKVAGPYSSAENFYEGYACVTKEKDTFLINTKGKRITPEDTTIKPIMDMERLAFSGHYLMYKKGDSVAGCIITSSGKQLTDYYENYSSIAYDTECNLFKLSIAGKTIIINTKGKEVLSTTDQALLMRDYILVNDNTSKRTLYDLNGNKISEINCPKDSNVYEIDKNMVCLSYSYYDEKTDAYRSNISIINQEGEEVSFPDGLVFYGTIKLEDKYLIILDKKDGSGKVLYDSKFSSIINDPFSGISYQYNHFIVNRNGKQYLYNQKGKKVLDDGYSSISLKSSLPGILRHNSNDKVIVCMDENGKYHCYDYDYNYLCELDSLEFGIEFLSRDTEKNNYYYIRTKANSGEKGVFSIKNKNLTKISDEIPLNICNGYIICYDSSNHIIVKNIRNDKVMLEINSENINYSCFSDGYHLFYDSKNNKYDIYNFNFKNVCSFVVE